jgi:hypothetical protein
MHTMTKRDEGQKRPQPPTGRGTPSTHSALSSRKDVKVRGSVTSPAVAEGEELKEDGYGHGV